MRARLISNWLNSAWRIVETAKKTRVFLAVYINYS